MVTSTVLKDILIENERFILSAAGHVVPRRGVHFPDKLKKVIVFYGVRRSGKTFILFDLFRRDAARSLYVDFEDERLADFNAGDFERLIDAFLELKPHMTDEPLHLFLDEVQNIEGWERFCRRAVEREKMRVFVSGSSSKVMPAEIHTELRGRSWGIEVLPFSFAEYLESKAINPEDESLLHGRRRAVIKRHFLDFLHWGGFPEVCELESDAEKSKLLKEYMGAMFFRDLVERYGITNIPLLDRLSDKLFSSFSLKLSLNSFYRQSKDVFPLSKDMLFRYYKYFLDSMLVFESRKLAESPHARTRNPAKLYLADTGLAKRALSADFGRLLENAVFLELKRRGFSAHYFQGQRECDLIAKNDDLRPIQVSYELNDGNREREIMGLVEACKRLKKRQGAIVTYDDEALFTREGIRIDVIPAWRWILRPPARGEG